MARDKDKLLSIINDLESDYLNGRISEEKYLYFRSKYYQKLNAMDKKNKGSSLNYRKKYTKNPKKPLRTSEDQDKLVEQYILNPKNRDKNNKKNKTKESGSFSLSLVLVLIVGFTIGIGLGIFVFDFGDITSIVEVNAIVDDTSFPMGDDVNITNTTNQTSSNITTTTTTTSNYTTSSNSNYSTSSYDSGNSGGSSSGSSGGNSQGGDSGGGSTNGTAVQ